MTSPEQSQLAGPAPPHRYGLPSWACRNDHMAERSPVSTGNGPPLSRAVVPTMTTLCAAQTLGAVPYWLTRPTTAAP